MQRDQNCCYRRVCELDNLYRAFLLAKKSKSNDPEVWLFESNLLLRLSHLGKRLRDKAYRVGKYQIFTITEPKKRLIMALPFEDRVVQHALCQVILPILEKHFTTANAANRKEKGTHYAMRLFTQQLVRARKQAQAQNPPRELYVLKADISGFFYNIDRKILKMKLTQLFGYDPDLYWLIETIIDSSPDILGLDGRFKAGKGLPIGNLTSQFWAIYYLSDLDHFVKEQLLIKNYVRYMDDFTLLHHDKDYLRECKKRIADFLWQNAGLELNQKTQVFSIRQGVDFLGWHFYQTPSGKVIRLIRKDSKERRRRANKKWQQAYAQASNYRERAQVWWQGRQSLNAWYSHAKHDHTYHLRQKLAKELVLIKGD